MRILALDQSTKITGWAVFDDNELFDCGKFEITDDEIGKRLMYFKFEILKLIFEFAPDKILFEDIQLQTSVGNNVQTFKKLAMVYGVLQALLEEEEIPQEIISASTWKSKLNIKGRSRPEQKRSAQEYAKNTYNVKASQDTCDAICIGASFLIKEPNDWRD